MATQRLTIFLLRDVDELDDALADDGAVGLDARDLTAASGLSGRFYSKKSFPRAPAWARYAEPAVEVGAQGLRSASASGLLLLSVDECTFALTFG